MHNGKHPVTFVFDTARARGLFPIPVVGLMRTPEYLRACGGAVSSDKRGACIRIQREDFVDFSDLNSELQRVMAELGTSCVTTDILLDLRAIGSEGSQIDSKRTLSL